MARLIFSTTSTLSLADRLGAAKVRLGMKRMNYTVKPGLYALGRPDSTSPVLVSANYKLSFDTLRKELDGFNLWILVLDTKGVNVWCAAGKGTFGTDELIHRMNKTELNAIVSHRRLILPQLGAPGIAAHEVTQSTGFQVIYGPVLAKDIPEFIANGLEATPEMRRVPFELKDRLTVAPLETVQASRKAFWVVLTMVLLDKLNLIKFGLTDFIAFIGSIIMGTLVFPVMLPYLPFNAFSAKGSILGLIWSVILSGSDTISFRRKCAYPFILTSIIGYLGLNFTGSTTYTSLSGVKKETKLALPVFGVLLSFGLILLLPFSRKKVS